MGNIACCQQRINFEEIDDKEEVYIRETLDYFSKRMIQNSKLQTLMKSYFSIILLDIEGNPMDWISEQSYNDFISKIFQSTQKEIELIKLEYKNTFKNLSITDYHKDNFHLLLSIWLIGIAPSRTINDDDKIEIIKQIILKCNKYITFKTFSNFLITFLELMLIEITYNFRGHNRQETEILLNDTYRKPNVNEYCRWLCSKMGKIITKNKKIIRTSSKAINNEYINEEHLKIFFKKYSFLLKPIELRQNFYNKYR